MRFVLNVDAETAQSGLYYVTVHREECHHAARSDVARQKRYWVRGPLNLKAVRTHLDRQVEQVQARFGKKLNPRSCKSCKPGVPR